MNKVTTTDLRTIRTKKAIHAAFQEMSERMGVEHITVKELAQLAGINRKTFYSHYDSIDALEQELLRALLREILQIIQTEQPHSFHDTLGNIYRYLCGLPVWYRNLLCAKDSPLGQLLFTELMENPLAQFQQSNDPLQLKQYMKLRYIASSSMELFKVWHESDGVIGVEDFVSTATGLICFGEQAV